MRPLPNLILAAVLILFLLAVPVSVKAQTESSAPPSAESWTAYREARVEAGETLVIMLEAPGIVVSYDDLFEAAVRPDPDRPNEPQRIHRFRTDEEGLGAIRFQLMDEDGLLGNQVEYNVVVGRGALDAEAPPSVVEVLPAGRGRASEPDQDQLDAVLVDAALENPREPIPPGVLDRLGQTAFGSLGLEGYWASTPEIRQLELASELFSRRYYEQAVVEYRRLINVFPQSSLAPLAQFKIGEAYHERAKEYLIEAENLRARRLSGRVGEALDNADSFYAAAVDAFARVVAFYPASGIADDAELYNAASRHGRAKVAYLRGETQEFPGVIQEYLRTVITNPRGALADEAVLGIAEYYRDRGDAMIASGMEGPAVAEVFQKAVDQYLRVAREYSGSSSADDALFALGRIYDTNLEMRDFEKAVQYYDELAAAYPASPYAEAARGRSRFIKANYL